ncbi:MAG: hypothetical protein QG597_2413 [Actinomycetota bacterium]|nr:hypothetical protein [Actinomycetota bacterium]
MAARSPRSVAVARNDRARTDPTRDVRRLCFYFGGLATVYLIGVWWLRPTATNGSSQNWVVVVMAAPTVGALFARVAGPGVIVWGRLNRWLVMGLTPAVVGLAGYGFASALGLIEVNGSILGAALLGAFILVPTAMITATGEEIGWRGFLWPLVRRRFTFVPAWLLVTAIWWLYHVPVIALGWYGSLSGLPAFTLAILGFGAFVSVITDRSHAVWPSIVAHGAWNGLVATSFAFQGEAAFTGDGALMGEFGWLAAISMAVLGTTSVTWHLRTGGGARMPYPERYRDRWTADVADLRPLS